MTFLKKSKAMLEDKTVGGKVVQALGYSIGFAGLAVWFALMSVVVVGEKIISLFRKKEVDEIPEDFYNYK